VSRWIMPIAGAAAVAVLLVAGLQLVRPAPASVREQTAAIAAELRCPDCQALSVADSPTRAAMEIRRQIEELLAAGATPDEVRAHFVARYGEWILLAPRAAWVWILPFILLLLGTATLVAWLRRGGRRRPAAERGGSDAGPGDAERARLRDELEALDA
jgi:cytochrome c-type biogenesis protein CcmH